MSTPYASPAQDLSAFLAAARAAVDGCKKHEIVNFDARTDHEAGPKTPCLPSGLGEIALGEESGAPIVGGLSPTHSTLVSPTHPTPPPISPDHTDDHPSDDLENERSSRGSEATAAEIAPASRSDAIPASSDPVLDLIRANRSRYPKERRPDRIPRRAACDRAKSHHTQPRADELPILEQLRRANYSLSFKASAGATHLAFTVNLSREIEKQALAQADPFDWLYRRLGRQLGDLCRLFVIVAEDADVTDPAERARRLAEGLSPTKRHHWHGELACRPESLGTRKRSRFDKAKGSVSFWTSDRPGATVYNAILKAAGAWDDPTFQLNFRENPDRGWLGRYVTKHGMRYKMTYELRRLWKADYASSREMQNERIKRVVGAKMRSR